MDKTATGQSKAEVYEERRSSYPSKQSPARVLLRRDFADLMSLSTSNERIWTWRFVPFHEGSASDCRKITMHIIVPPLSSGVALQTHL